MKNFKTVLYLGFAIFTLNSCITNSNERQNQNYDYGPRPSQKANTSKTTKYVKSPIDKIITKYIDKSDYTVILADMDYKEATNKYLHKYRIIIEKSKVALTQTQLNDTLAKADDIEVVNTEWQEVTPTLFNKHKEDLGMTILSKTNNVLDKNSSPAGMNNYVGNTKYGHWQTNSSGNSFWAFYGRYHFFSSMFRTPRYGYSRYDYNHYNQNYRNQRSYYGRNNDYGTKSTRNTSSTWSKKPQTFKSKVNSKVTRSAAAQKSRAYNSSKSYSKTKTTPRANTRSTRTTRNSSRYSRSSSSRSRSGGFGK